MRANRSGAPQPSRKNGVGLMNAIQRQKSRPQTAPRQRGSPASDPDSTLAAPTPVPEGSTPLQRAPTADLGASPGPSPTESASAAAPSGNQRESGTGSGLLKARSVLVSAKEPAGMQGLARRALARSKTSTSIDESGTPSEPARSIAGAVKPALSRARSMPAPEEQGRSSSDEVPASPPDSTSDPPAAPRRRSPVVTEVAEVEEVSDVPAAASPDTKSSKLPPQQLRRRTALMAVDLEEGPSVHSQIRNLFGNGERVDPKTWVAFAEKLQHSGQSQPMAGHLDAEDHERKKAQKAADDEYVHFLSDSRILQVLRDQPATPSTARIRDARRPTQRRAMSAAFTDRGVRLREGQAAQAIFNYQSRSYEDGWGVSTHQPLEQHPAGQPTHACTHNVVADPLAPSNHCYGQADSPGVRKAFEYAQGCAHDHELLFQQSMKRKGRVSKETLEQWKAAKRTGRAAEGGIRKSPEGGNPTLLRSGASYVLNPRDEDPPHPHDRLFKERKARGEFRYGNSSECHRQAINWNQDLYRFEVLSYGGEGCRALYRATSCPHKPSSAGRNPITGQIQDENRTPRRPTEHTQKAREKAGKGVKTLTNHQDLEAEARQTRESRLNTDASFANLCKAGAELGAQRLAEVSKIKATQFRGLSVNVANALKWDD
mmetsp:Transcript_27160/g.63727  ORF Transcript_27160/g.63727 Transcript_27160/m.63727 type:complete len:657 (+) Transcript_27160:62-2032(+)